MQKMIKTGYECIMILLVTLTIVTIWTDGTYTSSINWIVWFIFFIDFIIRFATSEGKWVFVRKNPFLVIAIIPFDQFFQMARIVRVFYLFRIKTIAKYYITPHVEKLTYKALAWIISVFILLFLVESVLIWKLDNSIYSYVDALLVVVGYLFFFGHRFFEIESAFSIWALTGTSIFGVVMQGLALQWAFSKVETVYKKKGRRKAS